MLLKFQYVNWKGEEHRYVIEPDARANQGNRALKYEDSHQISERVGWYVNGYCISRDGELRAGTPRRSFLIDKMRNIEEIASLT